MTTGIHHVPCGRYFRDELHQKPALTNRMMGFAGDLILRRADAKPYATPKIMQMSGTPIRLNAKDWVGIASLWSLCVVLKENSWDLPKSTTVAHSGNIKHWPAITKSSRDQFWQDYTPSGLTEMTAQWGSKPDLMKIR